MLRSCFGLLLVGTASGFALRGLRRLHIRPRAALKMQSPQAALVPKLRVADLGFEQIATIPRPGAQGLSKLAFSLDDRYVTHLGSVVSC